MVIFFLEYDFTIVYNPGKTHVVANALSKLWNSAKTIGVPNQTTYANLFYTKPKWLNDVKEILKPWQIEGTLSIQQN
jgi:hypothetical protein